MADKKISALTAATTPLNGTEVLPLVQSGVTVKATNNDLRPKQIQSNATSGVLQVVGPAAASTRVMTTPDANFTAARTDVAQTFTGDNVFGDTSFTGFVKVSAGKGLAYTANTAVYMSPEDNIQGARIAAGGSFKLLVGGGSEAMNVDGTSKDVKATAGNIVIGTTAKGVTTGSSIPLGFGVNNTVTAITIDTASNVGIGTASPAATAILDVQSTTKGVRFPNMTTVQKNLIAPSAGTVIFDTTLAKLCVYSGAAWQTITSV